MTRRVSRRWFGYQLGAAITGAVVASGSAKSSPASETITVPGTVSWNNRARGILSFKSDGANQIDLIIHYSPEEVARHGFSDDILRKVLRPGAKVSVRLDDRLRQGGGLRVCELICDDGRQLPIVDRATVRMNWLAG